MDDARRELASQNSEPIIASYLGESDEGHAYELLVYVRTVIDSAPTFTRSVQIELLIPGALDSHPPQVRVRDARLFHPNFTVCGEWVENNMRAEATFEEYLLRLVRVLQFKDISTTAVANRNAMAWYHRNNDGSVFPTDPINYRPKPRITVMDRSNHLSE